MVKKFKLGRAMGAMVVAGAAVSAQAAAVKSTASAPTGLQNVASSASTAWAGTTATTASVSGYVSYGVDALAGTAAANDFYGLVSGNDSDGINGLNLSWGNGWSLAARDNTGSSDDVANTVLGLSFSVNAGAQSPAGHWTLTGCCGASANNPVLLDMVAVLKSSSSYGLYYFQDVFFDGYGGGDWLSPSFNKKGVRQDLSHLSLYVRPGTSSAPVGGGSAPVSDSVSLPSGGTSASSGGGSAPVSDSVSLPSGSTSAPSGSGSAPVSDSVSLPSGNTSTPSGGSSAPVSDSVSLPSGGTSAPSGSGSAPVSDGVSLPTGGGAMPSWDSVSTPPAYAAVPEPGSLALVGLGLAGLLRSRRRAARRGG